MVIYIIMNAQKCVYYNDYNVLNYSVLNYNDLDLCFFSMFSNSNMYPISFGV